MKTNISVSDTDFIKLFTTETARDVAKTLGITERTVFKHRRRVEERVGINIESPRQFKQVIKNDYPHRAIYTIKEGIVIVGSDAHIWPGELTTAQKGFIHFLKLYKKQISLVVLNGDVFDGAGISRFPSIGWEEKPTVKEELSACKIFTNQIEKAVPESELIWTKGNHDLRFETYLANNTPDINGVLGTRLFDHFKKWKMAWSCWINDDVVIKHRLKGGVHATHNNTLSSGRTMVTGHLHSQKVTPYSDYNGTRWGVDCGTLADTEGEQFRNYTEDNPLNWRSGFAVLTFNDGKLLPPEIVQVWDKDSVTFRGKVYDV